MSILFKQSIDPQQSLIVIDENGGKVQLTVANFLAALSQLNSVEVKQLFVGTSPDPEANYSFIHKSANSPYHFIFLNKNGQTILSSQDDNLFISEGSFIRPFGNSLNFLGIPYNGTCFNFLAGGNGVFSGNNIFINLSPSIRSESTDSQIGFSIQHQIEQGTSSTGEVKTFFASVTQIENLTRQFSGTAGNPIITITDPRGSVGLTVGDTVVSSAFSPGTTIINIDGADVTLSSNLLTNVTSDIFVDTSVVYLPTDIPDYTSYEAEVGPSVTQKAFRAIDTNGNLLFAVAGDGSFTFAGGTLTPAQTGWTVSNPVVNRTLDVSTATLDELREIVGTLIEDLKTHAIVKS